MTPFFITGLPRSGTAWLANLFSPGKAICFHEPDPRVVVDTINRHPGRRVGACDSTLVRKYDQIVKLWPDARWLYVTRPLDECLQSYEAFLATAGIQIDRELMKSRMEEEVSLGLKMLLDGARVAGVEYQHVTSDADVAVAAWHWLCPEIRFDRERWEILRRLNVQQDLALALKEKQEQSPNLIILPPA